MEETYFINIPEEANLRLPNPELLNYYKGLKNREYWIEGEISEDNFSWSDTTCAIWISCSK